jgi:hypothetical protein
MPNAPFYKSKKWGFLREAVIRRSRGQCEVPGCTAPGKVVDHIISPRNGGRHVLANLRHLCRAHDNQVKEDASGKRRGGGQPVAAGCYADGSPRDPAHPWFVGDPGRRHLQ